VKNKRKTEKVNKVFELFVVLHKPNKGKENKEKEKGNDE
jgi:hypothetical protein